jgi:hypothetical protein
VQAPGTWPIQYQSARKALQADHLLADSQGAEGYARFVDVFKSLAIGIGASFDELEQLCVRREEESAAPFVGESPEDEEAKKEEAPEERVWLLSPGRGASEFDAFYEEGVVGIGWDFLGDLTRFANLEALRQAIKSHRGGDSNPYSDALACQQFARDMRIGDVVFAKRGQHHIVGYGVVSSDYRHEPERKRFKHVRSIDWKRRGDWFVRDKPLVTKTLTEIGRYPGLVADIHRALGLDAADPDPEPVATPSYRLDDAAADLFLSRARIEEALDLLVYKKNLVLQGPPGVGKTFVAQRLAYLLLGDKDPDRIAQVQFHQSYSYEDFVQGYRPTDDGKFGRVDGPFMRFCDRALQDPEVPYVLLIDEINRGNLSKIFGELLLLIEGDKRDKSWAAALTYSREKEPPFYVPGNLHIIGTMNTADRSLALVDYALRRRFAFIDVEPGFSQTGFARQLSALGVESHLAGRIRERFERLNQRISDDPALGIGFCVGHSYFCQRGSGVPNEAWYKRVVQTEVAPLLKEYWFDDGERAAEEIARLLDDD